MARIRTIKPSFFTSLTIADLTVEQRLTFIGLWTHSDDAGRSIYDPRLIKAALWPLDDRPSSAVAADVCALTEASLITHYIVGDRSYLSINTWREHQRINRPAPSTLPAPSDGQIVPLTCGDEPSLRIHGGLTEASPWEGKGKEGNGRGRENHSSSPATPSRVSDPAGFPEFWHHYPRKVGKDAARKAWISAVRRADPAYITSAAARYATDRNLPEAQFIPHPSKWLNDGRWEDGPLPPRGNGDRRPTTDDRVAQTLALAQQVRDEQNVSAFPQIGA